MTTYHRTTASRDRDARARGLGETGTDSYRLPLGTGGDAGTARLFARRCLEGWGIADDGPFGQDVVLVVSELVTNALRHAGRAVEMRLSWDGPLLVVEVDDSGEGLPVRGDGDVRVPGGHGLVMVDRITRSWSVRRAPHGGKTVRAELVHP
ncbi:hypothetical protein GCM10010406_37240 [Streptomyces thermolineatus]|uniref:Histidine kinase/HSP90-like ATPase domain-containing protein n=1 Tax=Streptomyces thermolineatus TaxID=44033 RepID=A0ABN3M8F1_9ACTN